MPKASTPSATPPKLLSRSLDELRHELLRLTRGSDRIMVQHLISGLEADVASMTPAEVQQELLAILIAVAQTLDRRAEPRLTWSSEAVSAMS